MAITILKKLSTLQGFSDTGLNLDGISYRVTPAGSLQVISSGGHTVVAHITTPELVFVDGIIVGVAEPTLSEVISLLTAHLMPDGLDTDKTKPSMIIPMIKLSAPPLPKSSVDLSEPVTLSNATALYQLSFGTDSASRYVVVGIANGIAVSARYKGSKLSIRAEGKRVKGDLASVLETVGMSSGGENHKSMHLQCDNATLAARALAACMVSVGINWETPLPNYNNVFHKEGVA